MDNRSPYLSAEQLGIEQWERDGLIALLGPLARGELALDMMEGLVPHSLPCFRPEGCIAGWLAYNAGKPDYIQEFSPSLLHLFLPGLEDDGSVGYHASPEQAATATINFLTTKRPQWSKVMRAD